MPDEIFQAGDHNELQYCDRSEIIIMNNKIRVWDPLIRIFHWGVVVFFTIAYLSGEEESDVHIYSGYIVLGLIIFRVVWGFVGSRHARFSDFVTSPGAAIAHFREMAGGRAKRYLGHNPAGGWMIIALLLTLFVVSVSGLKVYAIEEGKGPLAANNPDITLISTAYADDDDHDERYEHGEEEGEEEDWEEEFWEEIHEASSNFMLMLIFLHIAGVFVSGRAHNENLVKAMVGGYKDESL